MATVSFFRDVEITNPDKIRDVKSTLKSDEHAFADIQPVTVDEQNKINHKKMVFPP